MEYRYIREFMQHRIAAMAGKDLVIDGMLKDCNQTTDSFSEWSRKGSKKGSRDVNLLAVRIRHGIPGAYRCKALSREFA